MPNPFDPYELARQAYQQNNPGLFQQAINPYIGQQVQHRIATMDMGEGQSQRFHEFLDPITGQWNRSTTWVNDAPQTEWNRLDTVNANFGHRAGEEAYDQGNVGNDRFISPHLTYGLGDDGNYTIRGGGYEVDQKTKNFDAMDLMGLLAVAGGAWGLNALGGAGGAAGGASTGANTAAGAGGFLGDATAAGYAGLDAASAATLGGGASVNGGAALGALGGAGAGLGAAGAGAGSAGAGAGTAGAAGTAAAGTAGAGGLASMLGSASGLLGPLATLAGAAAGAQGSQQSQSQTRDIPDWLKPYVTGQNGILNQAQGLLSSQMSPEQMQGFTQMRTAGQGLLSQPVAGNGFARFFPGS